MTETTWIEFEAHYEEAEIMGFMALDEADDEAPLNFYDWQGFECGGDITDTKPYGSSKEHMANWEKIVEFFTETDIVKYLVKFAREKKIIEFGDIELYINFSKYDCNNLGDL